MHADWQELSFELAEWKATGTHILRGGPLDEAQTLLDDHIIKSRAMSASPFAKPFAADILPWVTRLTRLNAILEQWLTCQVLYPDSLHTHHTSSLSTWEARGLYGTLILVLHSISFCNMSGRNAILTCIHKSSLHADTV